MSMSMNECQWSMTMTLFDPLLAFCKSYILSPIRNNARKNAIRVIDDPLPLLLIHEVPFAQPSFRCIFLGIFGRLMVIQVQAVPIRQRHRRNWRNLVSRSNVINWAVRKSSQLQLGLLRGTRWGIIQLTIAVVLLRTGVCRARIASLTVVQGLIGDSGRIGFPRGGDGESIYSQWADNAFVVAGDTASDVWIDGAGDWLIDRGIDCISLHPGDVLIHWLPVTSSLSPWSSLLPSCRWTSSPPPSPTLVTFT